MAGKTQLTNARSSFRSSSHRQSVPIQKTAAYKRMPQPSLVDCENQPSNIKNHTTPLAGAQPHKYIHFFKTNPIAVNPWLLAPARGKAIKPTQWHRFSFLQQTLKETFRKLKNKARSHSTLLLYAHRSAFLETADFGKRDSWLNTVGDVGRENYLPVVMALQSLIRSSSTLPLARLKNPP